MEFKVGDRVRRTRSTWGMMRAGDTDIVEKIEGGDSVSLRAHGMGHDVNNLTLVNAVKGGDKMGRETYRLLKDTPELKKGAIVQEMCDDGTQDFRSINDSDMKFDGNTDYTIYDRKAVESQPEWFERVYPATETAWLNKEEIKKFKEFLKNGKGWTYGEGGGLVPKRKYTKKSDLKLKVGDIVKYTNTTVYGDKLHTITSTKKMRGVMYYRIDGSMFGYEAADLTLVANKV